MGFLEEQLDKARRKALGERGKEAEHQVKDVFIELGKNADFDWHRNYDARTALGKFPAQTGDFEFYFPATHGVAEVKELKHDYRLPRKNFKGDTQLAKLLRRRQAGGVVLILVHHTAANVWRRVPFEFIWEGRHGASWDLRGFETYETARAALRSTGVFARYKL